MASATGADAYAGRGETACYTRPMKRSAQEIIELVVFALIALLLGTGVVWFIGWLLGFLGLAFTWISGLVWSLLRFLVPVAIVVGGVYLLVRLLGNNASKVATDAGTTYTTPPSPWTMSSEGPSTSEDVSSTPSPAAGTDESPGVHDAAGEGTTNGDESGADDGESRA